MPKNKPSIVEIPRMNYIAVRGIGNPNEETEITKHYWFVVWSSIYYKNEL